MQRAFDQVVHDVCIQELPVVFAMDRGGVVGNDGHTHQGVFDIAYLRCLPNMVVMSPRDENELRHMVYTAVQHDGPIALRYPRGSGLGVDLDSEFSALEIGKSEVLRRGSDALIVGFGPVVQHALDAAVVLVEEYGIDITVVNARFAKPLDTELLAKELPRHKVVCTVEDHALLGGFGSAVIEFANDAALGLQSCIKRFGVADEFVAHASQAEQYEQYGYDTKSIVRYVSSQVERPSAPRIGAVTQ